mgnify:CR=1 FL=1
MLTAKIKKGMTKEEVEALWGKPNTVWYLGEGFKYYSGPDGPDEDWYYAPPHLTTILPKRGWDVLFKNGTVVKAVRERDYP